MKSPITGKEMFIHSEERRFRYKGKTFFCIQHLYKCEESGEYFTDTSLGETNFAIIEKEKLKLETYE